MYIVDIVVYDRNHYFGLGPIPKPKPELTDTVTDTETTFQRENLVTNSMYGPLRTKIRF